MSFDARQKRTPIYLFSGFLGSGKTTLINSLIKTSAGSKFGVIVNEFGEMDVDGALIREAGGKDIVELPNGCFCCASKGDLGGALQALIELGGSYDYLLVESSGLANPGPVVETIGLSALRDQLYVKDVVTVIDAQNFDRNLDAAEAAFYQIAYADLLIINKIDSVPPEDISAIATGLGKINDTARQIINSDRSLSLEDLKSQAEAPRKFASIRRGAPPKAKSLSHAYETHTLKADGVFNEAHLRDWLESLPESVVRAKGIVRVATGGRSLMTAIHLVSGSVSLEPLNDSTDGEQGVVVIGTALNKSKFQQDLDSCRMPVGVI